MMTFDSIYGKAAETQPVIEEISPHEQGPAIFVLYESGLNSKVLGTGSTYNEMYASASKQMGLPEDELRKAGYKFAVEHLPTHGLELEVPDYSHVANDSAQILIKRQAAMAKARAAKAAKQAARKPE